MASIAGLPDLCRFVRRSEKVKVYLNTVQLVIGEEMIEVSGCVMSQRSEILEDLVGKQYEIYLDQFVGEKEGIQDCVEMLYGGTVEINTLNLKTMLKFSVMYQILDMYKLCIDWLKGHISTVNLFSMIELGLLIDAIGHDKHALLDLCKNFIVENIQDNLFELSQSWSFSNNINFIKFFIHKDILSFTLPILISWVNKDSHIRLILDEIAQRDLTEELLKHGSKTNHLITKMTDKVEVMETSKKLHKLQINIYTSVDRPCSSKALIQSSNKDLIALLSEDYNTFSVDKILELEKEYGLEHFQFVEIGLAWIMNNNASQEDVNILWSNIRQSELSYWYLFRVRATIVSSHRLCPLTDSVSYTLPDVGSEDITEYQCKNFYVPIISKDLEYVKYSLNSNNNTLLECTFPCCECGAEFDVQLRLEDKQPCCVINHGSHDIAKHWYIRWKDDYGVLCFFSLITNNYSTVIKKIKEWLEIGTDIDFCYMTENIKCTEKRVGD